MKKIDFLQLINRQINEISKDINDKDRFIKVQALRDLKKKL
jgi:hypothetical protein